MTERPVSNQRMSDRWSYLWLVIATVLLVLAYGMYRNPLAALLAPVFLIRFLRTRKVGVGYLLIYLALAAANTISWWNVMPTFTTPGRIFMGFMVGFMYSIPLLLDRVLVRRFRGFAATLVFPFANAAFDFLTIWPNPLSTYGSIANSLFGSVYLTQLCPSPGCGGSPFSFPGSPRPLTGFGRRAWLGNASVGVWRFTPA